jgi:dipeptidyl-peptidase-3
MRIFPFVGVGVLAASMAWGAPGSPVVERIGDRAFLQVETPSFERLALPDRIVAFHLAQAAIQLDPIFYDQMSSFGLEEKRLLGAMVEDPARLPEESRAAIVSYAKLFLANGGNRNETTNRKFVPSISAEQFGRAAEVAREKGARLGTRASLASRLERLRRPLFDPDFQASITVKNPPPGEDILTASSNNYYADVTAKDLEGFHESFPLDSRLAKMGGELVEEVYRAGTPDGKVPPGRYARELTAVNRELERAVAAAGPDQARVIRALVRFYQTGDLKDWHDYNVLWIRNNPPVDFASGFIEVYRDARGVKGSSQMLVATTDSKLDPLMKKLAENAVYFETKAPWLEKYKKLDIKPPEGRAVETIVATGDFRVGTVGDNLPNEADIRQQYGTKSIFLSSSVDAFNAVSGSRAAVEFWPDPSESEAFEKYGKAAGDLQTALHEIVGHGSGKIAVPHPPETYLKEYYSTLEEARADLVAYWDIFDSRISELGVENVRAVGEEMYRRLARQGLTTLNHYPKGSDAEEDHDRNRLLIVNYLIEAGAFEQIRKDGKSYIIVKDYDKAHESVGRLLAEIMRIKAEGDYDGIKALVQKYGIHFDPALRDEVVARYKKLDLASYYTGVYGDLDAVRGANGAIHDVHVSYPRDFLKQQLRFAKENGTIGF